MSQLTPLQLDDGTLIYLEATDDQLCTPICTPKVVPIQSVAEMHASEGEARVGKGWHNSARVLQGAGAAIASTSHSQTPHPFPRQQFHAIEQTIKGYTQQTLNIFKQAPFGNAANVNKVTLEFGIQMSGEMGVPYITKGAAESNIKVTVECSFPSA